MSADGQPECIHIHLRGHPETDVQVTWAEGEWRTKALLTARGKDHDLTLRDIKKLRDGLNEIIEAIEG